MTSLDEAVLPRELQMLKAFLPFLPAPAQKMLAVSYTHLTLPTNSYV